MKRILTRAYRVTKTRLLWGWRLYSLGDRSALGKCRLVTIPKSICIGHHTTIADDWSLVDLQPAAVRQPKIRIGSDCYVMHDFQCNAAVSVEIQDRVLIGPRVFITDSDHVVDQNGKEPTCFTDFRSAPVVIEHNCWLGANAVVVKGVRIGHHSVVGANAVVTRDVPPCTTVGGIPARAIFPKEAGAGT